MTERAARAAAREIVDAAVRELVHRGAVGRVGPMRFRGRPHELDLHIEAEMWPDRTGRYFRVLWGIDRRELHDAGSPVGAEHCILGGDLKGLLGRGAGVLPIKLPGERAGLLDFLPRIGSARPSTSEEAVEFVRSALIDEFLPLTEMLRTRTELAEHLAVNRRSIDRNGLRPEGEVKDLWAARLLIDACRIESALPHVAAYLRESTAERETRAEAMAAIRSAIAEVSPNYDLDRALRSSG